MRKIHDDFEAFYASCGVIYDEHVVKGKVLSAGNPNEKKLRPCLRCQRVFMSVNSGKRVCHPCSERNARQPALKR